MIKFIRLWVNRRRQDRASSSQLKAQWTANYRKPIWSGSKRELYLSHIWSIMSMCLHSEYHLKVRNEFRMRSFSLTQCRKSFTFIGLLLLLFEILKVILHPNEKPQSSEVRIGLWRVSELLSFRLLQWISYGFSLAKHFRVHWFKFFHEHFWWR